MAQQQPTRTVDSYRLAIDIGGTFTDAVLVNERTGNLLIEKVLTTPADPSEGFLRAIHRLVEKNGIDGGQIHHIVHGTTVATNALLERRGAKAALITTEGFRDILEIGRQIRHELYDLQVDKPQPLIPRELCFEIPGRIGARGELISPLDEEAVVNVVDEIKRRGVEAVAICLLHSYIRRDHEDRVAEIIRERWPEANLSISSDIAPEVREYWRASTTVINAYIRPKVQTYLSLLEERLGKSSIDARIHIMQSSGGLMSVKTAAGSPVQLLESGPAGGVQSAAFFARKAGIGNAIAFDMGGTTAKMGVVKDGFPRVVPEFEAGGVAGTGAGVAPGSGYPVLAPVVDLVEVGAGGGSIAWVDDGGLLRVGPHSAGSDPGPACYGRGGVKPTVTDANLVLGRLNADYFLGGEVKLSLEKAAHAIDEYCAKPLGCSRVEAAMGIISIANSMMSEAMRLVSVQRGVDPKDLALVVSGGAAPAHAVSLAEELGIPSIIVPPSPGTASALGMLISDLRHEFRTTRQEVLQESAAESIHNTIAQLEMLARKALADDAVLPDAMSVDRYVELRYLGQSWCLKVPFDTRSSQVSAQDIKIGFHQAHQVQYGYAVTDEQVELVNIGVLGTGRIPAPRFHDVDVGGPDATKATKGQRRVFFEGRDYVDCSIYDRYALRRGNRVEGPAIVEEMDSTTVIPPGCFADVTDLGMLHIHMRDVRHQTQDETVANNE